jgi:hypothetical protein
VERACRTCKRTTAGSPDQCRSMKATNGSAAADGACDAGRVDADAGDRSDSGAGRPAERALEAVMAAAISAAWRTRSAVGVREAGRRRRARAASYLAEVGGSGRDAVDHAADAKADDVDDGDAGASGRGMAGGSVGDDDDDDNDDGEATRSQSMLWWRWGETGGVRVPVRAVRMQRRAMRADDMIEEEEEEEEMIGKTRMEI